MSMFPKLTNVDYIDNLYNCAGSERAGKLLSNYMEGVVLRSGWFI